MTDYDKLKDVLTSMNIQFTKKETPEDDEKRISIMDTADTSRLYKFANFYFDMNGKCKCNGFRIHEVKI